MVIALSIAAYCAVVAATYSFVAHVAQLIEVAPAKEEGGNAVAEIIHLFPDRGADQERKAA
jgi:hypothetical protein